MGFFNIGFLGLNFKNDIILILYLKSKESPTYIIMFVSKLVLMGHTIKTRGRLANSMQGFQN